MSLVQTSRPLDGVTINHEAVLNALKLNPKDPTTQALLLVCDRYGLDPLLKHMVLVSGNPYVTRDGLLAVAHRSGVFDGIEVLDQGADATHYTAKVAVYRKDMSRPFTYIGRFPKNKPMAKDYGPEMAVKCAEVMALRRAFNVTGISAAEERWDEDSVVEAVARPALPAAQTEDPPADPAFDLADDVAEIGVRCKALSEGQLGIYTAFKKAEKFPSSNDITGWTPEMVRRALERLDAIEKL